MILWLWKSTMVCPFGYTFQHPRGLVQHCCIVSGMWLGNAHMFHSPRHLSVVTRRCLFCTVTRLSSSLAVSFPIQSQTQSHHFSVGLYVVWSQSWGRAASVFFFPTPLVVQQLRNRNLFPSVFFSADIDTKTTTEWHAWIMWWLGGSG